MDPAIEERDLASILYEAVQLYSLGTERTQQSQNFKVGVSDLGFCSERTRRLIAEIEPDRTDMLDAFIGTAIGEFIERASLLIWPDAILQAEVNVTLTGESGREYIVPGHPDIIRPDWGIIDGKTTAEMTVVEQSGPSRQQLYQRHCYALAAHRAGLLTIPLEQVKTANVWIDRTGDSQRMVAHIDTFDMNIVNEAADWLDNVVYAHLNGEEARKEPPREMCYKVCGHVETCRAMDTDVTGRIDDPYMIVAARVYADGAVLEKQGKQMKEEAKRALDGVNGSTGEYMVRWTNVPATDIAAFTRKGYKKFDLKPIKK